MPKRKQRSNKPIYLGIIGGVLLVFAALMLVGQNNSPPQTAVALPPDSHDEAGLPFPEVPRIPLADAKRLHDAREAIFVDVRTQGEYETARIPEALSFPLADLESRYQELPQEAEIITYCT